MYMCVYIYIYIYIILTRRTIPAHTHTSPALDGKRRGSSCTVSA